MQSIVNAAAFIVIWGCTLGATYWVWGKFGAVVGFLFFLFGAGLAGFVGVLALIAVARLFGVKVDS